MKDKKRILRLLVLLMQKNERMSVRNLAEKLQVSRRTIYRDVEDLKEVGFKILTNKQNVRISAHTIISEDIANELELNSKERKSLKKANVRHDLQQAIRECICVILMGYSSPSSNTTRDRLVEPFSLSEDGDFLWAYEPESKSNKVFRLSRINNIKMLEDQPWLNNRLHQAGYTDAFHIISIEGKKIPVRMRMKRRAYNLLKEEFPSTEAHITYDNKRDEWIYEDYVSSMVGIGRFVVGLSDCITIETPELRSYIRYFAQKFILGLPYPE